MAEKLSATDGTGLRETRVKWPTDVLRAAEAARRFAEFLGFPEVQREELGLVVTELASNLLRHAVGGTIKLRQIGAGERTGIEILSLDTGPGFRMWRRP